MWQDTNNRASGAPETFDEVEQLRVALAAAEDRARQAEQRIAALERTREDEQRQASARMRSLALAEANRRVGELMSISSHELRTPLTSVKASVQLVERRLQRLADENASAEATAPDLASEIASNRTLLRRAEDQINVLNRLVGDLLDATRVETGTLELRRSSCDLAIIVHTAIKKLRAAAPTRTITPPDIQIAVTVLVDSNRIEQVVTHYLSNALKYSADDRPIVVELRVESDTARVSVSDDGYGIPEEELERVWERFYRVPKAVVGSGSGAGLGLGLYLCKAFIERHSGQVGVESTVGRGSTFWFTLPLHAV